MSNIRIENRIFQNVTMTQVTFSELQLFVDKIYPIEFLSSGRRNANFEQ